MASEIRVDKITSLSGVGTISPSPTGVEIAGITTAATLKATTGIVTTLTATTGIVTTFEATTGNITTLRAPTGIVTSLTTNTLTANNTTKVGSGVTLSPDGDVFATGISTFSGGVKTSGGNITISQPAGTNAQIIINEGTTTNGLFLRQTATQSLIQTGASQPLNIRAQGGTGSGQHLALWTKESERIRIQSGGNIGIGTSAPATILHVQANAGDMLRLDRQNNSGGVGNQIAFRHNNATGTAIETGSINCVITANADTGQLRFYTKESGGSNTEKLRILPAGGITFNGDSTNANALDDYEEGTYTPTLTGNTGGDYTLSSSYNNLAYTKIGRIVHITGRVRITAKNSATGDYINLSLPFQSSALTGYGDAGRVTGTVYAQNTGEAVNDYVVLPTSGGNTYAHLAHIDYDGTGFNNMNTEFSGNELVSINITYVAA